MGADPIIYCLEQVTDYAQFERLCHDVMALNGYPNIEPLGGFKDKGRDAIHVSRSDPDDVTIFAYSVREDWRTKIDEDAANVRKNGHTCSRLVFLSTSDFTPGERDTAVSDVESEFGWELELWGLERFRVFLSATHPEIVAKHPQIFTPPFFPQAGGLSLARNRDYIVVDHTHDDSGLATWLARRLMVEGYHAWSRELAPVAGESLTKTVESLIETRAFRLISVLSHASVSDADLAARRTLSAATEGGILLPILASPIDRSRIDSKTRDIEAVSFVNSWGQGLSSLLEVLEAAGCPRSTSDPTITTRSFVEPGLVTAETEMVVSNRFQVLEVPSVIHRFVSDEPMDNSGFEKAKLAWAFRRVDSRRFLSFWEPPDSLRQELGMKQSGGSLWDSVRDMDEIATRNLAPELVKKSLQVKCIERGLLFCEDRYVHYFPDELVPSNRLYFTKPDGSRTWVGATGERTYWRPGVSEPYKHHLAVVFSVVNHSNRDFSVLVRIRVRLTDKYGKVLGRRSGLSRRKHLCRNWWNDDWLHRVMAIMQFLSCDDDVIACEQADRRLVIAANPDKWEIETRLNEAAIKAAHETRDDALQYGTDDDDEDDDAKDTE